MMLNKNGLLTGILLAFIFPALAVAAAYLFNDNAYIINKPALPYLAAIALNLLLLRFNLKWDNDKTGRGIMFVTFVFMLSVFIFKVHLR